jgi:hypothetical protein
MTRVARVDEVIDQWPEALKREAITVRLWTYVK